MIRHYSQLDRYLIHLDQAMRTIFGHPVAERPTPSTNEPETKLTPSDRKHSAALMRVNHAGEISAQALYQAQALTARSAQVRDAMTQAAQEENDHLAWCADRLAELKDHISYLTPFWYLGSFAIGTIAGLAGDRWSLGFLAETERQVVQHLDSHLEKLPHTDQKSVAIVKQMRIDEAHHASMAVESGAASLPSLVQMIMTGFSKVMTKTAYWI